MMAGIATLANIKINFFNFIVYPITFGGVDTASIDHGPSKDFVVHRIALGANVPGLENAANLGALPETGAWVVALPMKIAGGTGGPLRIVALAPR